MGKVGRHGRELVFGVTAFCPEEGLCADRGREANPVAGKKGNDRPALLSILVREHDSYARRTVIVQPTNGLEPHQRRDAVPVVVPDVSLEAHHRAAVAAANRTG
jgi:hypothetical protein